MKQPLAQINQTASKLTTAFKDNWHPIRATLNHPARVCHRSVSSNFVHPRSSVSTFSTRRSAIIKYLHSTEKVIWLLIYRRFIGTPVRFRSINGRSIRDIHCMQNLWIYIVCDFEWKIFRIMFSFVFVFFFWWFGMFGGEYCNVFSSLLKSFTDLVMAVSIQCILKKMLTISF